MTPEHWQLISRLYHDALAREAGTRRRFSARRVLATRLFGATWNRCSRSHREPRASLTRQPSPSRLFK